MSTNIDYWEKVIQNPTLAYKNLFNKEEQYLQTHIIPGSRILDIGCGDGRTILSLLNISQNMDGIDNDKKAVQDAKDNLKTYPSVHIQGAESTVLYLLARYRKEEVEEI